MSQISGGIIPDPFSDGADFHLAIAGARAGTESFLFIPRSDLPGLTLDIIRLDLMPRQRGLRDLFETIGTGLIAYAGLERAHCELVSSSPTDIVFRSGFTDHPLAGTQTTVGRLTDLGGSISSLQAIRKIEPLAPRELDARIAFVSGLQAIDLAALRSHTKPTEFIANCQDASRRLVAAANAKSADVDAMEKLVVQASPLHETIHWAVAARLVAADLLARGKLESFGAARRMLGLAVLNLDDARSGAGDDFFRQQIRAALDPLAELLLCDIEGDRAAHVRRAGQIWRLCLSWDNESAPDRAGQSEVMAAFAESIAQMNRNPRLDAGLGAAAGAALQRKDAVESIVEGLYAMCRRMTYAARRLGAERTLLLASCLGADLAQLLVERAAVLGSLDFDTYVKQTIQAAQWQIAAQLALFGLTQDDLSRANTRKLPTRPLLFYLRPLGTARRELMPNRFPASFKTTYGRQLLPDTISIEAALQAALVSSFQTQALGGPIDIFGMGRGTVLARDADGWKGMAKINMEHAAWICVLPGDSEGLAWELGEILRQGAASRTIFILPPKETIGAPPMSPAAHARLGAIGFTLPKDLEPGFVFVGPDGGFDRRLPFEWLWDGRLEAELRGHAPAASAGQA